MTTASHILALRTLTPAIIDVLCDLELDETPSADLLDQPAMLFVGRTLEMDALIEADGADATPAFVTADATRWDAWDRWQFGVAAFNAWDDGWDCCDGSGCSHCD